MAQRKIPTEAEVYGNPEPNNQAFHVDCGGEVIVIQEDEWGCMKCGGIVPNESIEIVEL
jgi:hypothetical protein